VGRLQTEWLHWLADPQSPQPPSTFRSTGHKPNSVTFLPFVGTIFNRISRVLARNSIKSVGLPYMKLSSLFRPVKDHRGLKTPNVYNIPCECGRVYIGQMGRSVDIRLKKYQQHIQLEYPNKSAMAEHSNDHRHCFQLPLQYQQRGWLLSQYIMEASYWLPKNFGTLPRFTW
jgi:hypothetical protein